MKPQVEKRNTELEIGELQQKRAEIAKSLSYEWQGWKTKVNDEQLKYDELKKFNEKEEERLESNEKEFIKDKNERQKKLNNLNKEFGSIISEKKRVIRILESINSRILQAEDYYRELNVKNDDLQTKVNKLEELYAIKENLEQQIGDLRATTNDLMSKKEKARLEVSAISKVLQEQVDFAHKKMIEYENRTIRAENKERVITNDCNRKMRDLQIYQKRIEKAYANEFPNTKIVLK